MLSENIQLRGRIIELEKQVEDGESQRIADHALAIKAKLEAQLTEWGDLISGLGLEPPPKRHSPGVKRATKRRTSFNFAKASPSQRRLRDVAKDIEELGHISEYKSYPRKSMKYDSPMIYCCRRTTPGLTYCSPEQILALRSEVDLVKSPELGPPPVSQFINDDEPTKVDSPQRASPIKNLSPSPKRILEPPVALPSPQADEPIEAIPSPEKPKSSPVSRLVSPEKDEPATTAPEPKLPKSALFKEFLTTPTKQGKKRKLTARDETDLTKAMPPKPAQENQPPPVLSSKPSVFDKTRKKTPKELTEMQKEFKEQSGVPRKPLSAKSTNDDISSPKKMTARSGKGLVTSDNTTVKPSTAGAKNAQERPRGRPRNPVVVKIDPAPPAEPITVTVADNEPSDLGKPLAEPELLSPNSPESAPQADASRGDTPPPVDISCTGETSRPGRRNRTAVSYAEPNLRDKMRRPTKELVDAVVDRRSSQFQELLGRDSSHATQRGSDIGTAMKEDLEPGSIPASPLAKKGASAVEERPASKATERRKRPSSVASKAAEVAAEQENYQEIAPDITADSVADVDVYEVMGSSPQCKPQAPETGRRRQAKTKSARRFSSTVESDDGDFIPAERTSSRRRSMMV
jgi:hypothetical protein